MHKLVFIRYGDATRNLENRVTGWTDVGRNIPSGVASVDALGDGLKPIRTYHPNDAQTTVRAAWRVPRRAAPDFLRPAGNTADVA